MAQRDWSDEELTSAISAYIEMHRLETAGKPFTKAEFNRNLRKSGAALEYRTKSSIEYRMQNISAVLQKAELPIVKGYMPRRNVGEQMARRIRVIWDRLEKQYDTYRR